MSDREFLDALRSVCGEIAVRIAKIVFRIDNSDVELSTMNKQEAAQYIGRTERDLSRIKGFPAGRKIGRQRIYTKQELDQWIDQQQSEN